MNALTSIPSDAIKLALPADLDMPSWLEIGRSLYAQRRSLDWMTADWIAAGIDRFGKQIELPLLGGELGVDPKHLVSAARAAQAFPPSNRDAALTLQHHEHVADLPPDQRLTMLKRAHDEHWTPKQTRIEVEVLKVETGQTTIFTDDDHEYHELMALERAWNRARPSVRTEFMDLAKSAKGGVIDA